MTPSDHMSQDLSYFSGPRTSGAAITTCTTYSFTDNRLTMAGNCAIYPKSVTMDYQSYEMIIVQYIRTLSQLG